MRIQIWINNQANRFLRALTPMRVAQRQSQKIDGITSTNLRNTYVVLQNKSDERDACVRLKEEIQSSETIHTTLLNQIEQVSTTPELPCQNEIPKIIWIFWDKGLKNAPPVVQLAEKSWRLLNPEYEIRFLDANSIKELADFEQLFKLTTLRLGLAHKSDYLRTYLLCRFGGVWVDSTSFCWKPLKEWLPLAINQSGFFFFKQPQNKPDRQIANWFIASSAGNAFLVNLFFELDHYIFKPRPITLTIRKYKYYKGYPNISRTGTGHTLLNQMEIENWYPYHFYHYLFNVVAAKPQYSTLWQNVPDLGNRFASSHGPFHEVYISKQTYRGKYQSSQTYLERATKLEALLERLPSEP